MGLQGILFYFIASYFISFYFTCAAGFNVKVASIAFDSLSAFNLEDQHHLTSQGAVMLRR